MGNGGIKNNDQNNLKTGLVYTCYSIINSLVSRNDFLFFGKYKNYFLQLEIIQHWNVIDYFASADKICY